MIDVQGLRFRYPGAADEALRGLSFAVRPGEAFGLLGPSGTGKSTVVGVLTGALRGHRGAVRVLDEPGPADRERLARIGTGFEVPSLYPRLTARENLQLFAALHRVPDPDIEGRLARVGLGAHVDQRVDRYSKGMKSRLDLCRAMLCDPDLLFLDEPTAALDPGNSRIVQRLIRDFADAGGAVLLTTHDMHVAETVCDRVGLLCAGRLVACDTPRALRLAGGPPQVRIEIAEPDGVVVRTAALSALADDEGLRARLRAGQVQTVHTCEPTLEDVFVELTGRALA